jgi:hypothetical protein
VANLVQGDGQGHLTQSELACPVHRVMADRTRDHPGDYSQGILCQEPGNGQGKTPGCQGMDQQVAAATVVMLSVCRFAAYASKQFTELS